jgi:hypothetical protein
MTIQWCSSPTEKDHDLRGSSLNKDRNLKKKKKKERKRKNAQEFEYNMYCNIYQSSSRSKND